MRTFFPITATVLALSWLPIQSDYLSFTSPVGPALAQSRAEVAQRVREIQTALKHFGFYRGSIDGVMGPGTINGLNKFAAEAEAKGLTKSTGEITAADIGVLLKQYERSVEKANKAQIQTAKSGSDSNSYDGASGRSSGSVAAASNGSSAASGGGSAASASGGSSAGASNGGSAASASGGGYAVSASGSVSASVGGVSAAMGN